MNQSAHINLSIFLQRLTMVPKKLSNSEKHGENTARRCFLIRSVRCMPAGTTRRTISRCDRNYAQFFNYLWRAVPNIHTRYKRHDQNVPCHGSNNGVWIRYCERERLNIPHTIKVGYPAIPYGTVQITVPRFETFWLRIPRWVGSERAHSSPLSKNAGTQRSSTYCPYGTYRKKTVLHRYFFYVIRVEKRASMEYFLFEFPFFFRGVCSTRTQKPCISIFSSNRLGLLLRRLPCLIKPGKREGTHTLKTHRLLAQASYYTPYQQH